jgi:hypothetical protein
MTTKVPPGFARIWHAELDNFTEDFIDAMTGSAAFPTPLPRETDEATVSPGVAVGSL